MADYNYSEIKDFAAEIQKQWNCSWTRVTKIEDVPKGPGIYRLILNVETVQIPNDYKVCGKDAGIEGNLVKGMILSVGKTKRLQARVKQHFGNNEHNNRLKKRLESINIKIETFSPKDGRFYLEYREIREWWKRDLLEAYVKAICGTFFDLEIEH